MLNNAMLNFGRSVLIYKAIFFRAADKFVFDLIRQIRKLSIVIA